MRRFDFRLIIGALFMLLGGLLFIERLGFLEGAASFFWGAVLVTAGAYFLFVFARDTHRARWAIVPGFILLALGGANFLPDSARDLGGALFLGAIGLSFFVLYFMDRSHWWGIIPGGVMFTLAAIALLEAMTGGDGSSGGVLFLGLGLTFLLVAILPNPSGRSNWAYIPAVVLLLMGAFVSNDSMRGWLAYLWPAALIAAGLAVVFRFFVNKE